MSDTPDDDMPDPIDAAYAKAEALLGDEAARAARRARLLGAIASEPGAAPASVTPVRPARQNSNWGRGGWLAAACVAGLSVFVVVQIYRPVPRPPPAAPASTLPTSPPAPPPALAPSKPAEQAAAPRAVTRVPPSPRAAPLPLPPPSSPPPPAAPPVVAAESAPPPPPPPPPSNAPANAPTNTAPPATVAEEVMAAPRRKPAAPPSNGSGEPSSESIVGDVVVTAERRQQSTQKVPVAVSAFTSKQRDAVGANTIQSLTAFPAKAQAEHGAALRAAAATGRVTEVEVQLSEGAPVDAPDAAGDTALIVSIRADQPDVAVVLRRHGASLDHRNHAGESARDLAKASGDAALIHALGLDP